MLDALDLSSELRHLSFSLIIPGHRVRKPIYAIMADEGYIVYVRIKGKRLLSSCTFYFSHPTFSGL